MSATDVVQKIGRITDSELGFDVWKEKEFGFLRRSPGKIKSPKQSAVRGCSKGLGACQLESLYGRRPEGCKDYYTCPATIVLFFICVRLCER